MTMNQLMQSSTKFGLVICLLCLSVSSGCNRKNGPQRVLVSGKPVLEGRVRFVPMSSGPVSIAFVKEGRYTTADSDGIPVGKHRVEILAYDPNELANRGAGFGRAPPQQLLPAKYNKQSELALDVSGDDSRISHDFVLD